MSKKSGAREQYFDAKQAVDRLCQAVGVESESALSEALGRSRNRVGQLRRDGSLPWIDVIKVALEKDVSLDWLILGRRPGGMFAEVADSGWTVPDDDGQAGATPARIASRLYPDRADRPDPDLSFRETRPEAYSQPGTAVPPPADHDRWLRLLRDVFEGVESALSELDVQLPPAKKADLVMALCELYADASAQPSRHHILQLVRSAS
ncbi:MAG: helix-turn-helix domain-containing protein [Salinisphaeraceae bacterium]